MTQRQWSRLCASQRTVSLFMQMHLRHLGVGDGQRMAGMAASGDGVRVVRTVLLLVASVERMGVAICGRQRTSNCSSNNGCMEIYSRGATRYNTARDAAQLHVGRR